MLYFYLTCDVTGNVCTKVEVDRVVPVPSHNDKEHSRRLTIRDVSPPYEHSYV